MQTITFNEKPFNTTNPQYLAKVNTITFTGQIVTDTDQPDSPVIAASSSFIGPVSWTFSAPVSDVSFDAGFFNNPGSTTIKYFNAGGTLLKSETNASTGVLHFSYSNSAGIAKVQVINTSFDASGFSVDNVTFSNTPFVVSPTTLTPVGAETSADINGLLWGYEWNHFNLTYSFPTSSTEYTSNGYQEVDSFQALNSTQTAAYKYIIDNYDHVSGLTFTKTTAANADLRFAEATAIDYSDGDGLHVPGRGTAEGNPPRPHNSDGATIGGATVGWGDVWFNENGSYDNPVVGSYAFSAGLMHELGHALGLKHGHVTQSDHGVTFPELPADHDSYEYSVMTYHQFVGDTTADGDTAVDHPSTIMMDDIAALQYLYGKDTSYNSGANLYSWDASGRFFVDGVNQYAGLGDGTTLNHTVLMTVWDGGGANDTFGLSNYSTNLFINLNPGGWTSLGQQVANLGTASDPHMAKGNIAIAYGVTIENATAGSGNDTILGNDANNWLLGGAGNDTIYGGNGADVIGGQDGNDLVVGEGGNDWVEGNAGDDSVAGGDGDDTVLGGTGNDWLQGDNGNDSVAGGDGDDRVEGGPGNDWLEGNAGNDVVVGGTGDDRLDGGAGNNWLEAQDGNDILLAGSGADHVDGGAGDDWIEAGAGFDLLIGGPGNDDFMFHAKDIQVGVFQTISGFGKVAGNFDAIFLEGYGPNAAFAQQGANALIYSLAKGIGEGIIVENTTVAQLSGHLVFV